MKRIIVILMFLMCGLLFFDQLIEQGEALLTCDVDPSYVPIYFFYNGVDMRIFGSFDKKADFVVVISDEPEKVVLRKKGKVKGIFWMNVGEISFEPVPTTFMVFSNKPIDKILSKEELTKYDIGYSALFQKVRVEPEPRNKGYWIKEFIRFKEKLRLYRQIQNGVRIKEESNGSSFVLNFHWPYEAPPGKYKVTTYAVQNGKVIDNCLKEIKIEKVGLLKTISNLAFNRPAVYGIIAIIIAVVAGIGVGLIFGGGKGGH